MARPSGGYGARMAAPVILCADGSDVSTEALAAGLELLAPDAPLVVVTVKVEPDPTLVTGTGMAGGVMSPEAFDALERDAVSEAQRVLDEVRAALGRPEVDAHVLHGDPGHALCQYAEQISAGAIVMGSRGRGGIRRALLGSVSDHVVRHAPCTVIITGPGAHHDA